MHMAYAWITFFTALTIHVCQPIVALAREGKWTDETRVWFLTFTKRTMLTSARLWYFTSLLLGLVW
jgi:hypothetical protein